MASFTTLWKFATSGLEGQAMKRFGNETEVVEKSLGQLYGELAKLKKQKKGAFSTAEIARFNKEIEETRAEIKRLDGMELGGSGKGLGGFVDKLKGGLGDIAGSVPGLSSLGPALATPAGLAAAAAGAVVAFTGKMVVAGEELRKFKNELKTFWPDEADEDLQRGTAHIDALSKTFGEDSTKIAQAANALGKAYGLSLNESLGLIEQGFHAGGRSIDDYLDQITEYSTQNAAGGFSAGESLGLSILSGVSGVFSDKGADVAKEFGLRIREQTGPTKEAITNAFGGQFADELFAGIENGTISSAEALKMVATQVKNFGGTTSQLQTVLADVFGGAGEDAGLEFIKQLADANLQIGEMIDKDNELYQAQQRQIEAQQELAIAQQEMAEVAGPVMTELKLIWIEIQAAVAGFIARLFQGVEAIKHWYNNTSPYLQDVLRIIGLVYKAFVQLTTYNISGLKDTLKEINSTFTNFGEGLAGREARAATEASATDLAAEQQVAQADPTVTGLTGGTPTGRGGTGGRGGAGRKASPLSLGGGSSGGGRVVTVNINGPLLGEMSISTMNMREGANELKERILNVILDAVNDSEAIATTGG